MIHQTCTCGLKQQMVALLLKHRDQLSAKDQTHVDILLESTTGDPKDTQLCCMLLYFACITYCGEEAQSLTEEAHGAFLSLLK